MSSVADNIKASASRNAELLGILSETDYAGPAFEQQSKFVLDLKNELASLDQQIAKLEKKRTSEFKDHEKYQKSIVKRFAYKATGQKEKFAAKAEKEEREYFDAVNEEHKTKSMRNELQSRLGEAEAHQSELNKVLDRHKAAQKDLDNLYDSIFEGPSPGFPEEDVAEKQAEGALRSYHDNRVRWESMQQAQQILGQAQRKMQSAEVAMGEARSNSQMDMFSSSSFWDAMERDALHHAEISIMETNMLIMQAQRMDPQIAHLPPVSIAKGNILSDVVFDNVFTDMNFHDKIKGSQQEVLRARNALGSELNRLQQRCKDQRAQLTTEEQNLQHARQQLQRSREQAFERVTGTGH